MNKIKLPFDCTIYDKEPVIVQNPFSGESCELTPEAVAVYDTLKLGTLEGDVLTIKGIDLQTFTNNA